MKKLSNLAIAMLVLSVVIVIAYSCDEAGKPHESVNKSTQVQPAKNLSFQSHRADEPSKP